MDRCVDCGEVISICDHAVKRLLDPERSYSLGEIERLRAENEHWIRSGIEYTETAQSMVAKLESENERLKDALVAAENALNNCAFISPGERLRSHEAALGTVRTTLYPPVESQK